MHDATRRTGNQQNEWERQSSSSHIPTGYRAAPHLSLTMMHHSLPKCPTHTLVWINTFVNSVQIEQKSFEMPPRDRFTVVHFLTVADIDRSARFHGKCTTSM